MSRRPFKLHHLVTTAGISALLIFCGPSWPQTPTDRADANRDGQTQLGATDNAHGVPSEESPIDELNSANLNPTGDPDKAAVLQSPEWQYVMNSLSGWLSIQKVYTDDEVVLLQRDFRSRVAGLNATELQALQGELRAKLDILLSRDALQARVWLNQQMSVLSENRAAELRAGLPDVADMTPAQMEEALADFKAESAARAQTAQANQLAAQQRSAAARSLTRQQSNQSARSQPRRAATFGHQPPPPRQRGWVPARRYEAAMPSRSLYYLNRARPYRW